MIRCAIYARYSSDLQRESSIDDQIRKCRDHAQAVGWTVVEEFVLRDEAVSAATLAGRDALQSLIQAAKRKPRPFDRILVDDTSRLARNIADNLRVTDVLKYHGVSLSFVSQGIDSEQTTARQLLTLNGMMDEQYLVNLAEKVHRGQEGRALVGLQPGGKCYGYRNVPIEDATRTAKYGRPAVSGVRLEIDPEQAAVVRRVFTMFEGGSSLATIAKTLNSEGVLSPQPPRIRGIRAWCPSSIHEMLRNERYRGVSVWNRTRKERNPETGRKLSRPRPKSDWKRIDVPDWRIVSEDLWDRVHQRIEITSKRFGSARLGGMSRTVQSRRYLFSGVLICGRCGSRLVIASGNGKRGYVKYGCPSHRYRGVCENKLTIRQDRLEEQLLAALEERVLNTDLLDYALGQFELQLKRRLSQIQKERSSQDTLHQRRGELGSKAKRIASAIAEAGHSRSLLTELQSLEAEIEQVERQIATCKPFDVTALLSEARKFAADRLMNLSTFLRANAEVAKPAILKHIKQLVLTPRQSPTGPVYEVSGSLELTPPDLDVMPLVARDGIEPPTPAFSGLRSTENEHPPCPRLRFFVAHKEIPWYRWQGPDPPGEPTCRLSQQRGSPQFRVPKLCQRIAFL
jgi:site-specific DNA recombinase